jgi:hypothetical protein
MALSVAQAVTGLAGEIPDAEVVLEVTAPGRPGEVPEAAPPRFVLLKDRQVFVGGSSEVLTARLEKRDLDPIRKLVKKVRKQKGLPAAVTLGPGPVRYRLSLRDGKPLELLATGDPMQAPPSQRDLAQLLLALSDFDHPALRTYRPAGYEQRVLEGRLAGGCRAWDVGRPLPPPGGVATVAAELVAGWPTGSHPASVCHAGRSLVVTLRPLLPGENPAP